MEIRRWDDIKASYERGCLVLGNGASMAIHRGFSYNSLREAARNLGLLGDADGVFDAFGTSDFEAVLRLLWHAEIVNTELKTPSAAVTGAYQAVRKALIETVREQHISYGDVKDSPFGQAADSVLGTKREFLTSFQLVASLNYDLLVYWSIMAAGVPFVDDFFRPDEGHLVFQGLPDRLRTGSTSLIYPHGNVFLAKDRYDQEVKLRAGNEADLLTTALKTWEAGHYIPLFVSEGNAERKTRAIKSSPYLSTAYAGLTKATQNDTLVLYGWSLGEQDQHIAQALQRRRPSRVAVSIYDPEKRLEPELDETFRLFEQTFNVEPDLFAADSVGKWARHSANAAS
jgi:hypothetical protein